MGLGSYVAAVAEISVTDSNKIKVHRIVAAIDPGTVVNPGSSSGRSPAHSSSVSRDCFTAAEVKDSHRADEFDTYHSMRIGEMPKVEAIVMPSGGFRGGVGEPTIAVAAPAVLNACFAATGKRIRSVPLSQLISFR